MRLARVPLILCSTWLLCAVLPAQTVTPPAFLEQNIPISGNGAAIDGVFTIPTGQRNAPVLAIFLQELQLGGGSGPASLSKTISAALATNGIANLRYDVAADRKPQAPVLPPTPEIVSNATTVLHFAASKLGAPPQGEFLIADGLAATLAPYIAKNYGRVAGIVLLAPVVLPIEDVFADHTRRRLQTQGKTEAEIQQELTSQNRIFADIRAGKTPADRLIEGAPARLWLDWMNRNPGEELRELNIPVLVLQGGQDEVVSQANYEKLEKQLGRHPAMFELHWYPDLDHGFSKRRAQKEVAGGQNSVDPQVIATIVRWLDKNARRH